MSAGQFYHGGKTMEELKVKTRTLTCEVIATTSPPQTGFRYGGRRIEKGEKVRLPLGDAKFFEKAGKLRIIEGSTRWELL